MFHICIRRWRSTYRVSKGSYQEILEELEQSESTIEKGLLAFEG